jgi:hypothetical protein
MSRIRVHSLVDLLNRAYKGSRWHSFAAALKGLTEEEARWEPPTDYQGFAWANGSALRIVFHVGADKIVQISTAFGESGIDWTAMEHRFRAMGSNLKAAMQIAKEGHETVLDALEALSDDDLQIERPIWGGSRIPTGDLFMMLAEHDFYHAGQIVYVRSLHEASKART